MLPRLVRIGSATATAAAAAAVFLTAPAHAGGRHLTVTATPGLSPSFRSSVRDYVSGCARKRPLRLSVVAPSGSPVSVDGARPRSGTFSARVKLRVGQATELAVSSHGARTRYHVRCLPTHFPTWRFKRSRRPQAQWYLFAPVSASHADAPLAHYVIIVDGHGTPVWWKRNATMPFNSLLLPNGDLAWTRWYSEPFGTRDTEAWEVHRLDGTLVRTLRTIGSPADTHDMEPLPNGNYLLMTYKLRKNVDLAPYGGPSHGNVLDGEIQELTPGGALVWSWNSKDHISLSEAEHLSSHRRLVNGSLAYDYFHLNSVEADGSGLVICARHVNAVYRIDRATGNVRWKLGGTKRPQSLKVRRDPLSPTFGGQHDARLLRDGTVTVYDNRTMLSAPRAVRFRINTSAGTATFVEQVTESTVSRSGSEGSARRLPGGDWVVSWGGTKVMSEVTSSGRRVWWLKFRDALNYRTVPIPFGRLSAAALRRAMDKMFPRAG